MKNSLIIIGLALIIGIAGGIWLQKKFVKPKSSDLTRFEEMIKIKELHLIKHFYQDVTFIHKKNDPNKTVKAITIVPVSISAYIDMKDASFDYLNDSIVKINLPEPTLSDPNYQIDKMEIKSVSSFQIHIGKDLYPEVLKYLKAIIIKRKQVITQLAVENGILDETREEAKKYIASLFKGFKLNEPKIEFKGANTKSREDTTQILSTTDMKTHSITHNPNIINSDLIPANNIH